MVAVCGCEDGLALRASKSDLKASQKLLTRVTATLDDLERCMDRETPEGLYRRISAIRTDLRDARMTIWWSKNVDLVRGNAGIEKTLKLQKKQFGKVSARFETAQRELARKRTFKTQPVPAEVERDPGAKPEPESEPGP